MDPLLDLIRLLRPRAALLGGGLNACGPWALSFRKRDDLLFCWIEQGECLLIRADHAPLAMRTGDFALIRTSIPFRLASDMSAAPVDSETAVAAARDRKLTLGRGTDDPVVLHAGKFLFDTANEALLTGLLPSLVHIRAGQATVGRVRALLTMNEIEAREAGPASAFIITRLVELILVEILRTGTPGADAVGRGLLAGLADPVTAKALAAMHGDVVRGWTVAALASLCNVSRSTFAARFRQVVGKGPIEYLLDWRIALARDELRRGSLGIGEIAYAIGFQSPSAFSTAFTRAMGCSPKQFASRWRAID